MLNQFNLPLSRDGQPAVHKPKVVLWHLDPISMIPDWGKALEPIAKLPTTEQRGRLSREGDKIKFVNFRFEKR